MLTAKSFNAEQALHAGLVNEIVLLNHLPQTTLDNIEYLLSLSFDGLMATKKLLRLSLSQVSLEKLEVCIKTIAKLRTGPEAQILIKKFLQKNL